MLKFKKGTSIISLALCAVAIIMVTCALVIATNNSAIYRAREILKQQNKPTQMDAYVKIYTKSEIETVARQAFANNYLAFYDNVVNIEGFEALVIGEIMQTIPEEQLEAYEINVTPDRVNIIKI